MSSVPSLEGDGMPFLGLALGAGDVVGLGGGGGVGGGGFVLTGALSLNVLSPPEVWSLFPDWHVRVQRPGGEESCADCCATLETVTSAEAW